MYIGLNFAIEPLLAVFVFPAAAAATEYYIFRTSKELNMQKF